MLSRRHSEADSEDTGIDLAPMLDFVLNLLIFFIITTSFIKEAGITVNKQQAVTAESKETGNILIAIRPNGDIWMDKRRVDIREVRPLIERLHVERAEDTVVIVADKESQTNVLTQVMDAVRGLGLPVGAEDDLLGLAGALGADEGRGGEGGAEEEFAAFHGALVRWRRAHSIISGTTAARRALRHCFHPSSHRDSCAERKWLPRRRSSASNRYGHRT